MLIFSYKRLDLLDVFLQAVCVKINKAIKMLNKSHPVNYFCIRKPSFNVRKSSIFNEDVVNSCDAHDRTEESSI